MGLLDSGCQYLGVWRSERSDVELSDMKDIQVGYNLNDFDVHFSTQGRQSLSQLSQYTSFSCPSPMILYPMPFHSMRPIRTINLMRHCNLSSPTDLPD